MMLRDLCAPGEVLEELTGVEVHHLTAGVDAGVSTSGCCEADELAILAGEFRKRLLHLILNRLSLGLVLKSEVGLAVVRDGKGVRAVAARASRWTRPSSLSDALSASLRQSPSG